jgi:membrane protease YdiL (CAAX protease family)
MTKQLLFFAGLAAATAALIVEMRKRRGSGQYPLSALVRDRYAFRGSFPLPALVGFAAGATVIVVPVLVCAALGWLHFDGLARAAPDLPAQCVLSVAIVFLWAAVEELIFRGAVLPQLLLRVPVWVALFGSAFIFAAMHLGFSSETEIDFLTFAIVFLDGLGLAIAYLWTGSLWVSTIWHAAKNLCVWTLGFFGFQLTPALLQTSYTVPYERVRAIDAVVSAIVALIALVLGWKLWNPGQSRRPPAPV